MVLHNNKWDRKAKIRYEKKHGIPPPKRESKPSAKWTGRESDEELEVEEDTEAEAELEAAPIKDAPEDTPAVAQELDFEIQPDYQDTNDIVARHIANFKLPPKQPKLGVRHEQEFQQLEDGIAAHKLKNDIQRRFGKSNYKLPDEDDDFWQSIEGAKGAAPKQPAAQSNATPLSIDPKKEAWLDNLIG